MYTWTGKADEGVKSEIGPLCLHASMLWVAWGMRTRDDTRNDALMKWELPMVR